jgi:HNH endonuclease
MKKKYVQLVKIDVEGILIDAKECTKCEVIKPLTDYRFKKNGLGKTDSRCKICVKLYADSRKREKAEYDKLYRKDKAEEIRKKKQKYYQENHLIFREKKKERYYKNRKYYINLTAKWVNENKDKVRETQRKCKHTRRAKERSVLATLTMEQWEVCKLKFNNICCYCGEKRKLTQDHFYPLSKGGEYSMKNIIPSCRSCNCSKQDKDFFTWYPQQSFYSKTREQKILRYLGINDNKQQIALF